MQDLQKEFEFIKVILLCKELSSDFIWTQIKSYFYSRVQDSPINLI